MKVIITSFQVYGPSIYDVPREEAIRYIAMIGDTGEVTMELWIPKFERLGPGLHAFTDWELDR